MSELDDKIKELEESVETLTKERDALKEATEKAEKDKVIAETRAIITKAIEEAELPSVAKERLNKRFSEAETADGITEAIQEEKDYIASLSESGTVKNLGNTKQTSSEESHKALVESFKRLDYSDEDAEIAARGR